VRIPEALRDRVNRNGTLDDLKVPRPLLTLEEFFEGNDDYGSIGCNLRGSVQPYEFYEVFKKLRARVEVSQVRVQITSWDDPAFWPFSDRVWVITSLARQDIQQCLGKRLHGDAIRVGWPEYPIEKLEVPTGMRPLGVWWD
jgi:hypothetical protein